MLSGKDMAMNALGHGMNACNLQLILGGAKKRNANQKQNAKKPANLLSLASEPLKENLMRRESKVRLVALFNMIDIQKEYSGYTMVYDGRAFRKLVPGMQGTQSPTRSELALFVNEILEAAKTQKDIYEFLKNNPLKPALVNYLKT